MRARSDDGSTVVEFALVFPIVLLVVLGIIQYGYQYWALETAAATAREAARRLIVGTDPTCTVDAARAHAEFPNVGSTPPTVTYRYANATNTAARGVLVTVTVRIQSLDLAILPVPDHGTVIQSATNRVENVPIDPLACVTP
ncbi:hypothetical protein GCM10027600_19510 [Nocardioides ginsengisegetis]|uniref:TadE family protein n=1 Tax=Nocardioides ginsengisegetis TaxID=661491 RepID=UPI0031B64A66